MMIMTMMQISLRRKSLTISVIRMPQLPILTIFKEVIICHSGSIRISYSLKLIGDMQQVKR